MYRSRGQRRRWPRSRAGGCLLWLVLLIAILIVLSLAFGGFQKGTKSGGLAPLGGLMIVAGSGQMAHISQ